jgi:hypothetical protein
MAARKSPQGMTITELEAAMTSGTYYRDGQAHRAHDLEDAVIDEYYDRMDRLSDTAGAVLNELLDAMPWEAFDALTQDMIDRDEFDEDDRRKMHMMVTRAAVMIPETAELVGQRSPVVDHRTDAARTWAAVVK